MNIRSIGMVMFKDTRMVKGQVDGYIHLFGTKKRPQNIADKVKEK